MSEPINAYRVASEPVPVPLKPVLTLRETAAILGINREMARQIEISAFRKLRRKLAHYAPEGNE